MGLKNLRDNLQKRDSEAAKRGHDVTQYNEWERAAQTDEASSRWQMARDTLAPKRVRATIIAASIIGVLLIVLLSIYFFIQYQRDFFTQEKVDFAMQSIGEVRAVKELRLCLRIAMTIVPALEDVSINVQFDEYFLPQETAEFLVADKRAGVVSIGQIPPMSTGEVKIVGQFIAPQNEVEVIAGTMKYTVGKGDIFYEKKESTAVTITSSPLAIDLLAPEGVVSGNDVEVKILYKNNGTEVLDDLGMVVEFPVGFSYREATPESRDAQGNFWSIGSLVPGEKGEIAVRGILVGESGRVQTVSAQMTRGSTGNKLSYTRDEHSLTIKDAPLFISQKIVGDKKNVIAGESVEYLITVKNTSDIPLRDMILRAYIDGGELLEYEKLLVSGQGFFDADTNTIEWKAVNIPELSILNPGESTGAKFSIPLKTRIPVSSSSDKNFTVTTLLSADSPDFPETIRANKDALSNALTVKVATKILFDAEVIATSGPMPPEAGQTTTFQFTGSVGSVNNDITDVRFSGSTSTGVRITGQDESDSEVVDFNDRTNQFEWPAGTIASATGVLAPHRKVVFDFEITPSITTKFDSAPLLESMSLDFVDQFTEQKQKITIPEIRIDSVTKKQ